MGTKSIKQQLSGLSNSGYSPVTERTKSEDEASDHRAFCLDAPLGRVGVLAELRRQRSEFGGAEPAGIWTEDKSSRNLHRRPLQIATEY